MAAKHSRQKTFHYKRAVAVGDPSAALGALLQAALAKEPRPLRRAERLGSDSENVRLISQCYEHGGMICGVFLDFTEGNFQPIIKLDEDELELLIDQLPPGDREQFIEGLLFFGIHGNHVVLLQSQALRSAHFEAHLNWLLGDHQPVLPAGARLVLNDYPTQRAKQQLRNVRSVSLRAPITLERLRHASSQPPSRVSDAIAQHLSAIFEDRGMFLDTLSAGAALELDQVELTVELRRTRRGGTSLIDQLAHTLRHADDDVFELSTASGRILRTGDLKLMATKSVQTRNGVPLLPDVAKKMHDWLTTLIDARHIDPLT
jgi:hypothetical protein